MAIFLSRAPMLSEYFKIEIDGEGELHTLPQVLDDYVPGTIYFDYLFKFYFSLFINSALLHQ
jgi:hypothetical protein